MFCALRLASDLSDRVYLKVYILALAVGQTRRVLMRRKGNTYFHICRISIEKRIKKPRKNFEA